MRPIQIALDSLTSYALARALGIHAEVQPVPALFGSGLRFMLFTPLPAALASYPPVDVVRHPSFATRIATVAATATYAAFALLLFERGLRHCASGNRITVRA